MNVLLKQQLLDFFVNKLFLITPAIKSTREKMRVLFRIVLELSLFGLLSRPPQSEAAVMVILFLLPALLRMCRISNKIDTFGKIAILKINRFKRARLFEKDRQILSRNKYKEWNFSFQHSIVNIVMFALQIDNLQEKFDIQIIVSTFMRKIFNDQLRFKSDRCIARRKRGRRAYIEFVFVER